MQTDVEAVKDRLPIEQVIASYVPLKRAGRVFKALCPFHGEKTPSFTVNPERQIFKCFGCGEGGDLFDFVMKIEGLTFPETLQLLAERAGYTLTKPVKGTGAATDSPVSNSGPGKTRLYTLNQYTARLWHTILVKHPHAESARNYLRNRGVSEETINLFQVGYAPQGPATGTALRKAGFTDAELTAAGAPTKFQDRITFPLCDITGKVVGFTGRLLETPNDPPSRVSRGPKYWNTPETTIFAKNRTVFALHLAKRAIQDSGTALLVEGQMDVILLHQHGYPQAVASSGTALTEAQLTLLRRFADTVTFAYDADAAGQEATERGIALALAADLTPYVVSIPEGKDPADCLRSAPETWETAYAERQPYFAWLSNRAFAAYPTLSPIAKKKIAGRLLPWVAQISDPIEQDEWLRTLAGRLQTDIQNLRLALSRYRTGKPASPAAAPAPTSNSSSSQPTDLAVALAVSFPGILPAIRAELPTLPPDRSPYVTTLLPILLEEGNGERDELKNRLRERLTADEQTAVALHTEELLQPYANVELDTGTAMAEFLLLAHRARSDARESTKAQLAREIQAAQLAGDSETVQRLFQKLQNLV